MKINIEAHGLNITGDKLIKSDDCKKIWIYDGELLIGTIKLDKSFLKFHSKTSHFKFYDLISKLT